MWYIVRLDSSRVATLDKVRSATLVSRDDPTRVKSNYIPVKTTMLQQIERCLGVDALAQRLAEYEELCKRIFPADPQNIGHCGTAVGHSNTLGTTLASSTLVPTPKKPISDTATKSAYLCSDCSVKKLELEPLINPKWQIYALDAEATRLDWSPRAATQLEFAWVTS